jgi:hypothetical protein
MSHWGYVMNALLNEDLKARDRRTSRRRRREQAARAARQRATRQSASASNARSAEVVRPRRAADLGA